MMPRTPIKKVARTRSLPTELPFAEAAKIYAYRLAILLAVVLANLFLLILLILVSRVGLGRWVLLPVLVLLALGVSIHRKITERQKITHVQKVLAEQRLEFEQEQRRQVEELAKKLRLIVDTDTLVDGYTRRVFVVHGHDEEAKQSVARFLENLELEVIILHEQPNQGRTIIEKFEDYADVGFAVVLLTPDDMGAVRGEIDNLRPRARQNVVLELGFLVGKLGRQRVCALYKGNVEIPSDFAGILWVPMDPGGAWCFTLGREMKAAKLSVDLNKLAKSVQGGFP